MSTCQSTRAVWSYTYEKGLVDVIKDHVNIPMYKTQNGWTTSWRKITKQFNEKFPLAHFTKQQMQSKEKELKENYKIIRDARKNSDNKISEFGYPATIGGSLGRLHGISPNCLPSTLMLSIGY